MLAAKGLVEFRRKLGTRVRQREQWNVFDADILRWHGEQGLGAGLLIDLVETRQLLEPAAARLAAARATMGDLGRMEHALSAMAAHPRTPRATPPRMSSSTSRSTRPRTTCSCGSSARWWPTCCT